MEDSKLAEICGLPAIFPESEISWRELVDRSPYGADPESVSEDDLAAFLVDRTDLIEAWLLWSGDKRSTPGAFFRQVGSRYELGLVDRDGLITSSQLFDEPARPCARFILHELAA